MESGRFYPYLDVIVNTFGIKRIMYGSDWPVCLVAASYEKMLGIVKNIFHRLQQVKRMLFSEAMLRYSTIYKFENILWTCN